MKCIIIDDEPLARKGIRLLSDKVDFIDIVAEFPSAIEGSAYLSQNSDIDLIFLDIEMPGLNGLEFLKAVPTQSNVILTTAYPQYALDAFELDVIDYLLKPIKFERFFKSVIKCKDIAQSRLSTYNLESNDNEFVYIKSERKFVKLFYSDIDYIKGLKDYVMIFTNDGKYMTAMNVGTIHKKLPSDQFARVSKSYIINIHKISQIDTDFIYLDDVDIPLGSSYKEGFIDNYVKTKLIGR